MKAPTAARGQKKPDPVDVLVGQSIRVHRLKRGMSQTELGDALGLTFQQIQKYEKGTNRVGAARLTHIADILEVPLPSLFGDALASQKKSANGSSPLEWLAEPGALRLIQAYMQVREPQLRRAIVNLVEKMTPHS